MSLDQEEYEEKLDGLENIDDELDSFELPFVKINSRTIALDFGFEEIPSLAFFQKVMTSTTMIMTIKTMMTKGIPTLCDVDLIDEGQVLKWILLEADLWVEPPVVEQLYLIGMGNMLHCCSIVKKRLKK